MEQARAVDASSDDLLPESRSLTGLRGIAAMLVMFHHFYLRFELDQHLPFLQSLLRKGYLGVDLFFVLSGFVMAMVYGSWFDGTRARVPSQTVRFLARRLARLWPLHATVLGLVILLTYAQSGPPFSFYRLLANFSLVQAWGVSAAINPPAWSVSTEFMAYLVFPAIASLCLRRRRGGWLCAVLILAALVVCVESGPPLGLARRGRLDLYFNDSLLPLLRCLAGFMAGMLAWRVGRLPWLRILVAAPWFGPAMLLAFVGCMLGRVNDLVIFGLLPLIVLGIHFGRGPVHRLLATNPLHALGVLSYATYLLHYALLSLFPFQWGRPGMMLPAYFGVTVALAAVLHRVIERPGRNLIRHASEWMLVALPRWLYRPTV